MPRVISVGSDHEGLPRTTESSIPPVESTPARAKPRREEGSAVRVSGAVDDQSQARTVDVDGSDSTGGPPLRRTNAPIERGPSAREEAAPAPFVIPTSVPSIPDQLFSYTHKGTKRKASEGEEGEGAPPKRSRPNGESTLPVVIDVAAMVDAAIGNPAPAKVQHALQLRKVRESLATSSGAAIVGKRMSRIMSNVDSAPNIRDVSFAAHNYSAAQASVSTALGRDIDKWTTMLDAKRKCKRCGMLSTVRDEHGKARCQFHIGVAHGDLMTCCYASAYRHSPYYSRGCVSIDHSLIPYEPDSVRRSNHSTFVEKVFHTHNMPVRIAKELGVAIPASHTGDYIDHEVLDRYYKVKD